MYMELKLQYNNTSNILIATGNAHKFKEIKEIIGGCGGLNPIFLDKSYGIEIIEDGKTYEENAKIKAAGYIDYLNKKPDLKKFLDIQFILSEDSGLEVERLDGAPGLFTARYAGENASDSSNIEKLLMEMSLKKECASNRRAKFVCYACLYDTTENNFQYFYGELSGFIAENASGTKGFGYDPVFIVPEFNKTAALLDSAQKNAISHRGTAFRKAADAIKSKLNIHG